MILDTERVRFFDLLKIGFPELLFSIFYALFVFYIEGIYGDRLHSLPKGIGGVLGMALAVFLGFRMNSAYDRWWEARKIMGELGANSRKFASKIVLYSVQSSQEAAKEAIDKLIEYNIMLKEHLLDPTRESKRKTLHLLQEVSLKVETIFERDTLEKFDLLQIINNLHDVQGKAERTKYTPFLNIYKVFTRIMVYSYVVMLPFFIGDVDTATKHSFIVGLTTLLIILISYIFLLINKLANMYGDPYTTTKTSLPLEDIVSNFRKDLEAIKSLR